MKHIEKLQELIHGELDDYGYFEGWELTHEEDYAGKEYYNLELKSKTIRFRVDENSIEVELGEDHWHETIDYNFTVKYFWMAILSWD